MDPYDIYMKQQEKWQEEISKRDERIKELERDLELAEAPYVQIIAEGNKKISEMGEHLAQTQSEKNHWYNTADVLFKENQKLIEKVNTAWEALRRDDQEISKLRAELRKRWERIEALAKDRNNLENVVK